MILLDQSEEAVKDLTKPARTTPLQLLRAPGHRVWVSKPGMRPNSVLSTNSQGATLVALVCVPYFEGPENLGHLEELCSKQLRNWGSSCQRQRLGTKWVRAQKDFLPFAVGFD